jgi:hypothetical protein
VYIAVAVGIGRRGEARGRGGGESSMLILMNVPLRQDREGVGRTTTNCVLEEQNRSTYANIWKIVHNLPTDILPYIMFSYC